MTASEDRVSLIELLVDQFYLQAIDEKSNLYLPKLIQAQRNPTYEPYAVANWEKPQVPEGEEWARQICAAVTEETPLIPPPGAMPNLSFSGVQLAGLSNVDPELPEVKGDLVTVKANLSTLATAPQPLTVSGEFEIEQLCCPSEDEKSCSGKPSNNIGRGTFSMKVLHSRVTATVEIGTTPDEKYLTGTVESLDFEASTTGGNMVVVVDITTVPEKKRKTWDEQAEKYLNSQQALKQLLKNFQQVMSQQSTRTSLSELITNGFRSLGQGG